MYRPASRALLRSAARPSSFAPAHTVGGRRFISTNPPHLQSRSWKSSALRWGIAAAGIYYYNTSPVFAEQPQNNLLNPNVDAFEDTDSPTLEALTASSRRKSEKNASVLQSVVESTSAADAATDLPAPGTSPAELEEEAQSQGAFNPITGEINWDCPCLGGMAYGPCGPEFKEAFSCFVYSTEEPKGMDCIDKFQNMQTCFRAHPEHYQDELADDEEIDAELAQEKEQLVQQIAERKAADEAAGMKADKSVTEESASTPKKKKSTNKTSEGKKNKKTSSSDSATSEPHPGSPEDHENFSEGRESPIRSQHHVKPVEAAVIVEDDLVPKAAHDARSS